MFGVLRYFSFFFWLFVLVIYQVDEEALEIALIVWTVINCPLFSVMLFPALN